MKSAIGIFNGNWHNMWKRDIEDEPSRELPITDVIRISRDVAACMMRETMYPELVSRGQKRMIELDEQVRLLKIITLEAQEIYFEQIEDQQPCQHTKGRSAEGKQLRCHECSQLFAPRNYSEVAQVAIYGAGKSLRGYTRMDINDERELNPYHDGVHRH